MNNYMSYLKIEKNIKRKADRLMNVQIPIKLTK